MNAKTIQAASEVPPDAYQQNLSLVIVCTECRTQRAFQINNSLKPVLNRESMGLEWETQCEDCGHKIVIQIVWNKRCPGWTRMPVELTGKVEVADEIGLSEQS